MEIKIWFLTFFVGRAARLLNGIKDYGQHSRSDKLGSGEANSRRREVAQARRALRKKTLSPSETTPPYERKKAMRAFCGRLFGRGKEVKRPFGCYDGLRDVRKTSTGIAMTKVVPDWPRLAPIRLKWNQRYRDGAYLFAASVWLFPTFRRNACISGKVALASGRLALLSACVSACSSWWAEQMECHDAVVCVSLRLIEQVLRSLWWVMGNEKRVSISPTLWKRFSLLSW